MPIKLPVYTWSKSMAEQAVHMHHSLGLFMVCIAGTAAAQLPPVAQALYDEAVLAAPLRVQYAINNNAQIIATPDSNSFIVQWFPVGADPATGPLIVTLHGSNSYAFDEFFLWHPQAEAHACGIIALQWYRGDSAVAPNDYFTDEQIYADIDTALSAIGYPGNKALLHGFSRGSAHSYAIAFADLQSGNNYFCSTLSNSGQADPGYPLYGQIDAGDFGTNVFAGENWMLYCGALDTNPQTDCAAMTNTQNWLTGQGADVDLFIQDPNGTHGGFHLDTANVALALDEYLACFNTATAVPTAAAQRQDRLEVLPLPFLDRFMIRSALPVVGSWLLDAAGRTIPIHVESDGSVDAQSMKPGSYVLWVRYAGGGMERALLIKGQ